MSDYRYIKENINALNELMPLQDSREIDDTENNFLRLSREIERVYVNMKDVAEHKDGNIREIIIRKINAWKTVAEVTIEHLKDHDYLKP